MAMPASTMIRWALMLLERGLNKKAAALAASSVWTVFLRGLICST
jgi:hypothetical protein